MRLACQQEDLNRGLAAVSRAIPARSTLPITQHVLLEAADDAAAVRRCYDEVEAVLQARLDALTLGRIPWVGQP